MFVRVLDGVPGYQGKTEENISLHLLQTTLHCIKTPYVFKAMLLTVTFKHVFLSSIQLLCSDLLPRKFYLTRKPRTISETLNYNYWQLWCEQREDSQINAIQGILTKPVILKPCLRIYTQKKQCVHSNNSKFKSEIIASTSVKDYFHAVAIEHVKQLDGLSVAWISVKRARQLGRKQIVSDLFPALSVFTRCT